MRNKNAHLLITLALTVLFVSGMQVNAQRLELSPFIGYETGANINYSGGTLHIDGGMDYGGTLNVNMGGGRYAELGYSHLSSKLSNEVGPSVSHICDLAVDYYSIGVLQEMKPDAKATPYGLFTLGWVNYRPTSNDYTSENKMHVSLAGGVKIRASEKVGIRLQARLLMPLYYSGTYLGFGSGGASYGVSGGIYGVQGDFTGALFFMF